MSAVLEDMQGGRPLSSKHRLEERYDVGGRNQPVVCSVDEKERWLKESAQRG